MKFSQFTLNAILIYSSVPIFYIPTIIYNVGIVNLCFKKIIPSTFVFIKDYEGYDELITLSNVSKVTSLWDCSLKVLSKCICLCHCLCLCLCLCYCLFFGQVMYPHHSDQMSQKSQVSRVALCMSISKVLSDSVTQSVSDKVTY